MQPGHIFRPVLVAGGERANAEALSCANADVQRFAAATTSVPMPAGGPVSGFTPSGVLYPEVAVFSQFDQILPHMALLHPLQMPGPQPMPAQQQSTVAAVEEPRPPPRTRASETRAQSDYASRHQAAEQRRRTRINERLERLRKIVPHAERSNTATFLEQVYNYIEAQKQKISELESDLLSKTSSLNEALHRAREPNPAPCRFCGQPPLESISTKPGLDHDHDHDQDHHQPGQYDHARDHDHSLGGVDVLSSPEGVSVGRRGGVRSDSCPRTPPSTGPQSELVPGFFGEEHSTGGDRKRGMDSIVGGDGGGVGRSDLSRARKRSRAGGSQR